MLAVSATLSGAKKLAVRYLTLLVRCHFPLALGANDMLMLLYTSNFEPVIMYVYLFFVWFCSQSTEIRYSGKCSCGVEKLFVANIQTAFH